MFPLIFLDCKALMSNKSKCEVRVIIKSKALRHFKIDPVLNKNLVFITNCDFLIDISLQSNVLYILNYELF